ESGTERFQVFAEDVASRLAGAQLWDEAVSVVARHAPRAAFVSLLAQAHRSVPPMSGEQAARWLERITDEEAASDTELALARAALYEQRDEPEAAARLLRRALGNALVEQDPARGQRLSAALARVSAAGGERPA